MASNRSKTRTRAYTKRTRALSEAETRLRILDATVALHEEIGPSRTTVSAIAERAGVQRLTVYRHFPDELAIFTSCSAHWSESHPRPDLAAITSVDERRRAREILIALYEFYRGGGRMLSHVLVDAETIPAIAALFAPFGDYLEVLIRDLERCWPRRSIRRETTIRFVVQFTTWRSLSQLLSGEREMADLVLRWIDHV